jgi:hypothetical protein
LGIILVFKKGVVTAKHVARMSWVVVYTGLLVGNMRGWDDLEDLAVDGSVILRCSFSKCDGWHGLDKYGWGSGQGAGTCECGDIYFGSIKCGKLTDQLITA